MWRKIKEIFRMLNETPKDGIYLKNITNSTIKIVSRPSFKVSHNWFADLLAISYDEEIKVKYIPELHQIGDFEINQLQEVLQFEACKIDSLKRIELASSNLRKFKKEYTAFCQNLIDENIKIIDAKHKFIQSIEALNQDFDKVISFLEPLYDALQKEGYYFLGEKKNIPAFPSPINSPINFSYDDWEDFLDTEPLDSQLLLNLSYNLDQVYYEMSGLRGSLAKVCGHCKIIVGNAGTGKTHISAHLVNQLKGNGNYILFFKPKQFNGDNVDLEERILQRLQVPKGYTLTETLRKINQFALTQNKRCFFIIDALNETTKSSIGFSDIWANQLQAFINQIGLFSHLYFICTLRTSYIDNIWSNRPSNLVEIKGFERLPQLHELCKNYFLFYKINVSNFNSADLSVFKIPLLLDLYCRLINEPRIQEVKMKFNMNTYLNIFENYITRVTKEIQNKLSLQKQKPIVAGFSQSSERFFQNNGAILSIDDFSDAFDADDNIKVDSSIARAVLEGYLIFIKDAINNKEIVKHTQQEVGGYLLAKFLVEKFPSAKELLDNAQFREKVIGDNPALHHQLRLDILKFLISINPKLILDLKGKEALSLSWWYLYNGYSSGQGNNIPEHLLKKEHTDIEINNILNVSAFHWLNPDHQFNFHFVAQILERLELWEFDIVWTFYIYKEPDFFFEVVNDNIKKIKDTDEKYDLVVSKFIAFATATTVRELRDIATIYLIEFGKKHPKHLLKLTEYSTRLADEYIYERLASCCYGVSLILQNDKPFVQNVLPEMSGRLFQLQFAENASHPVFNYVVIDSIKHLVDLAVHKGVFSSDSALSKYKFSLPNWIEPTGGQQNLINRSSETSWPDPIGMDFGIYTIPRLIDDEHYSRRKAIANVYKRIFELGYQILAYEKIKDRKFNDFYSGNDIHGIKGKIDRLGKKYSWKGFFDFAGVLLKNGQLDVFNKEAPCRRLSDVDIDISLPSNNYKQNARLYNEDLIVDRETDPEWYKHVKIDSVKSLFEQLIEGSSFIMLYGKINQQINEKYETRSYLIIDSFFIKKNKDFDKVKTAVSNFEYDWNLDTHGSTESFSKTYFGELYWADNMPDNSAMSPIAVPTGKKYIAKVNKSPYVSIISTQNESDLVEKELNDKEFFDWEPTLGEYRWESDSIALKGFSEYYPSVKLGKSLKLAADPLSGKVLAEDLTECFQCIHFDENYFQNDFNYLKSDLVRRYMKENDLALLYQVKQHSYDADLKHNRALKFFILE